MTQLTLKTVKIRKPHKCWGCTKEYPVGTKMNYSVAVDQGEFSYSYWCEECNDFLSTLESWQTEDGFFFGDLLNFEEYIQESRK